MENLINKLKLELMDRYDIETTNNVIKIVERELYDYNLVKKSTEIISYDIEKWKLFKEFCACLKLENHPDTTIAQYSLSVKKFLEWCPKKLDEVAAIDIKMFLDWYQTRRPKMANNKQTCSSRRLDNVRIHLNIFFEWLVNNEYLKSNCCRSVKKIKYQKKSKDSLSGIDKAKIKLACTNIEDKVLVAILNDTGCRISEVSNIKISDINMNNKSISVTGKGNKERIVYFSSETFVLLREYFKVVKSSDNSLFPSKKYPYHVINSSALRKRLEKIICNTNGKIEVKVTPHVFRHSFATDLVKKGCSIYTVQKMLGHESIATTEIYTHMNNKEIQTQYEKYST